MATIRTAIALYDGVTSPLQSMTRAMNIVLNSFEAMQTASSHAVDTSSIQQAREELARTETALDGIEASIRRADQQQGRLNSNVRAGGVAYDGLLSSVRRLAAEIGGIVGLQKLVGISDQMSQTDARLTLIVDDGGSVEELEKKIMASAMRSRAFYLPTAKAISQLGLMAGDAFSNDNELILFAENLNKQFAISGANAQGAQAATLQLTQAMASGVLRGEELNSVFEQAPNVIQSIADYLGVPIGKIRELASDGLITAEIVKNAMIAATDEINSKFASMPLTWGQVWAVFCNVALQVLNPLLLAISWLANNLSIIGPILAALALAFLIFQVASHWTQIAAFAAALYHGVVSFLSIGFGVLRGSTAAASAAVFRFNSALLANPITWIVLLIVILIGILYACVGAYNKFTGSAVSATGIIGAAFAVLGAHLINTFIIPTWNYFAAIANFFGNVFQNPVAAVKVLFYDMAETVIGYILNMAHAIENVINKIPGVQVNITGGLDDLKEKLERASQKVKDESGWVEYVKSKDFIDYESAARAGYDFGEKLKNKISGAFALDDSAINTDGVIMDNIANYTNDTASNTAAMKDSLEMGSEELSFLRDVAEREAVNRFTTAEVKVEMVNHNALSSNMDLDGVVNLLEAKVTQSLLSCAEGVHV